MIPGSDQLDVGMIGRIFTDAHNSDRQDVKDATVQQRIHVDVGQMRFELTLRLLSAHPLLRASNVTVSCTLHVN